MIRFPEADFSGLRRELLAAAPLESAAVLLGGHARTDFATRLLVREIVPVPPDAYHVQSSAHLEVAPAFLAPLLKRARQEGWSLILTHSHPLIREAWFSATDDAGEARLMPVIYERAPARPHGTLVVSAETFAGRQRSDVAAAADSVARVVEIGPQIRTHWAGKPAGPERFPERDQGKSLRAAAPSGTSLFEAEASDRNVRALGEAGQRILEQCRVAIVGLGGTGSIVAQQLAYLGVRELLLLDPDTVAPTDLNRLVGATAADVGRPKVQVAADVISRVRPDAKVKALAGSAHVAPDARPLLEADAIFCCTDSHGSRAVLNQIAYQYLIPVFDLGVRIDASDGVVRSVGGRVQMLAPGLACLVCHGLLDPETVRRDLLSAEQAAQDPYIVGAREPQPAVISLNSTLASLGVTMFLGALTGWPSDARHQVYLADRGLVRSVTSKPLTDCIVCSLRGALGRGDLWPLAWRLV